MRKKWLFIKDGDIVRIDFRRLAVELGNIHSYGGVYPSSAVRDWEYILIGVERLAIDDGITLTPDTLIAPLHKTGYPQVVVPYKDFDETFKNLLLDLIKAYAQGLADGWENARIEYVRR